MVTGRKVAVVTTLRTKALAIGPTDRLQRHIQLQILPQQGIEVQDPGLRDAQERIGGLPLRIHEKIVDADAELLRERLKTADALDARFGPEIPLGV